MELDWVSRLEGGDVDLTLDLPFPPHTPKIPTVGGSHTAAAGVPAAYVVRRDHVLIVTFRVWEEEWLEFTQVIEWGQYAEIITWTPDVAAPDPVECWLDFPLAGQDIEPVRDSEVPAHYLATVHLRRVDGEPWDLRYFSTVGIG